MHYTATSYHFGLHYCSVSQSPLIWCPISIGDNGTILQQGINRFFFHGRPESKGQPGGVHIVISGQTQERLTLLESHWVPSKQANSTFRIKERNKDLKEMRNFECYSEEIWTRVKCSQRRGNLISLFHLRAVAVEQFDSSFIQAFASRKWNLTWKQVLWNHFFKGLFGLKMIYESIYYKWQPVNVLFSVQI